MIWIYLIGMASCWLAFYLHCKVTGSFNNGELIGALFFSLVPIANLIGVTWVLGLILFIVLNTKFMNKECSVKRFNIGD